MEPALQTMINNLPDKTGKSLAQWQALLAQQNLSKHGEMVKWLKSEYQVSHGYANTIVSLFRDQGESEADLVELQYRGKEQLVPLYNQLISLLSGFGSDVTITPKKSTVSVIRKHQFVLIKPASKQRIDLGLKLKGVEVQGILQASGPFGSMCTHRIQLQHDAEINEEVVKWMKQAYEASV